MPACVHAFTSVTLQLNASLCGYCSPHSTWFQRLLLADTLLQSFGNAHTMHSHNSSRLGTLTRLTLGLDNLVTSCTFDTYLLETSRVVGHIQPHERNFHIFYELLAGYDLFEQRDRQWVQRQTAGATASRAAHPLKSKKRSPTDDEEVREDAGEEVDYAERWQLQPPSYYHYTMPHDDAAPHSQPQRRRRRRRRTQLAGQVEAGEVVEEVESEGEDEGEDPLHRDISYADEDRFRFARCLHAFEQLGFAHDTVRDLFDVLVGILQLGELRFLDTPPADHPNANPNANTASKGLKGNAAAAPSAPSSSSSGVFLEDSFPLLHLSSLLQVPFDALYRLLTCKQIKITTSNSAAANNEFLWRPLTLAQARSMCDAVSKAVYRGVCRWVVQEVNRLLALDQPSNQNTSHHPQSTNNTAVGDEHTPPSPPSPPPPPTGSPNPPPPPPHLLKRTPPSHTLLLVDLFGFDCFDTNYLDHLLINYANESLQQLFLHHSLSAELALYAAEDIYVDSHIHAHIERHIERHSSVEGVLHSVFKVLEDQCKLPHPTDLRCYAVLCAQMQQSSTPNAAGAAQKSAVKSRSKSVVAHSSRAEEDTQEEFTDRAVDSGSRRTVPWLFSANAAQQSALKFTVVHFAGKKMRLKYLSLVSASYQQLPTYLRIYLARHVAFLCMIFVLFSRCVCIACCVEQVPCTYYSCESAPVSTLNLHQFILCVVVNCMQVPWSTPRRTSSLATSTRSTSRNSPSL